MKTSTKAVLWSGLVFPGAGHIFLRRYRRGMLLIVPALLEFSMLVRGLIMQAEFILDKIESGAISPDPLAIAAMLDAAPETHMTQIAFWILVACWMAGMVDAYMLGTEEDRKDETRSKRDEAPAHLRPRNRL
jgi:hypothetical protein